MANQHAWISILGFLSSVISGASVFIAIVYAAVQLTRHRTPARWLILGLALWILSFIGTITFNVFFPRYFGVNEMMPYIMVTNLVAACIRAAGLLFIVIAVFSDRKSQQPAFSSSPNPELGTSTGNPPSDNPFASPRSN